MVSRILVFSVPVSFLLWYQPALNVKHCRWQHRRQPFARVVLVVVVVVAVAEVVIGQPRPEGVELMRLRKD